jgi:hypothetical protein
MLYGFVNCTKRAEIHSVCFSGAGYSLWFFGFGRTKTHRLPFGFLRVKSLRHCTLAPNVIRQMFELLLRNAVEMLLGNPSIQRPELRAILSR